MAIHNKQYSALVIGAIIIACVWTVHVFELLDAFAYDYLTRHSLTTRASEQLILIDAEKQLAERGDELWLPLLKNLLAQDARQVIFGFLPERVSSDFYQFAADSGKVVFGQQVLNTDPYSTTTTVQSLPGAALGKNIMLGLLPPPVSQNGIYRTQQRNISVEGHSLPTLEYLVAQRALGKTVTLTKPDYRINFIGGTARIPKIKLAQADNLIHELIADRVVLIGVYGLEPLASYFTPLSTATEQTPDVLFHAFALDTLLAERHIRSLSDWLILLIFISITAITLIFCQGLSFQRSLTVSLGLTLVYALICWLLLQSLFLWLPLFELLLTQWLSFMMVWRYRVVHENQVLESTLFNLSISLQEKAFPVSFYQSHNPWDAVCTMVNQSLHLNRMIFLERVPNDHRLKEIKAVKCHIEDVVEMRRDYERTPYSTVIQEQKPLLQERPYLKPLDIEEQQYLAPLIFAGDVLGFWAFTIKPSLADNGVVIALAEAYMTQISEILYYRQEWQKRAAQENNKLWNYLSFSTGVKSCQALDNSVALLDKRITELQQVFNSLNTGGVLYDLFGRVLLLNKYMEALAQSSDLKLYNMTAVDFIAAVTGYDELDARQIMQRTIFDRETISIPIANFQVDHDYILYIQPLMLPDHKQQSNDSASVFQISGILCELEDVTELKALYRLKEQLFERFSLQLANNLVAMTHTLSIFDNESMPDEAKMLVAGHIQDKIADMLTNLKIVNNKMSIDIDSLTVRSDRYPINGQETLKKAVADLSEYAALKTISLHLKIPELFSLVFASPTRLYSVLYRILTAMIDDTFEGSNVWISIEEKPKWVHYYFRNEGIGIANKKLQQLNEDESPLSDEDLKMEEIVLCVKRWEGRIHFFSQIGEGSIVTLSLKRFL